MSATGGKMEGVFNRLRPLCVELTRQHTQAQVKLLMGVVSELETHEVQQLQGYILFPLRLILKQSTNRSPEFYTDVVSCLQLVVSRSTVSSWEDFQDILNSLCLLISGPDARISGKPEELKLAVVTCLSSLLTSCLRGSADLLLRMFRPALLPALGHLTSILLALFTNEASRPLRSAAGKCLLKLISIRHQGDEAAVVVGDALSSFLPGITMAMTKVITGDVKQGHVITKVALDVWTEAVVIAMGDTNLELSSKIPKDNTLQGLDPALAEKLADLRVSRSEDWVSTTAGKLGILVQKVAIMVTHPSWQVRLAMVNWARNLLINCAKSMPDVRKVTLDVLVQLVADEYDQVASHSREALVCVESRIDADGGRLLETLEENVHVLATELPRLMRVSDDEKKLSALVLFAGYIKLLRHHVTRMLRSASHLQRVSVAMVQVLEMDTSHLQLVRESPAAPQLCSASGNIGSQRLYFKHFTDERIHKEIVNICQLLGQYGDIELLIDHFLEVTHQGAHNRKQAFYIINWIILGVKGQTADKEDCKRNMDNRSRLSSLIGSLLEEYLSPSNWNLPTLSDSQRKTDDRMSHDYQIVGIKQQRHPLLERTNNIQQLCILLEGIGIFAKVSGPEFKQHLVDVIYPLMERLGDPMAAISSTALQAADDISAACGYSGIAEMVCANSDYLVNAISLRLRHIERHPRSPQVLQAILQHSSADILPQFEDIVSEVLLILDEHYMTDAHVLMQVLFTLVQAIVMWYPRPPSKEKTSFSLAMGETEKQHADSSSTTNRADELSTYLIEYHRLKMAESMDVEVENPEGEVEDTETDATEETLLDDMDREKTIPQHIEVTKQILERCCHHLSSPNPSLRLLVLRIISEAARAMEGEQNELLPLAHKIWAPFVKRFQDDEPLVALQAIRTLETLCQTTGDFLIRRLMEGILPPMVDFLTKQAESSLRGGRHYKYTILSKLQVAVIETLGAICSQSARVGLTGCILYRVAQACLPYLSSQQPRHLQEVALRAFQRFSRADADTTWLVLIENVTPAQLKAPSVGFPNYKIGCKAKNEYGANIENLLKTLDS